MKTLCHWSLTPDGHWKTHWLHIGNFCSRHAGGSWSRSPVWSLLAVVELQSAMSSLRLGSGWPWQPWHVLQYSKSGLWGTLYLGVPTFVQLPCCDVGRLIWATKVSQVISGHTHYSGGHVVFMCSGNLHNWYGTTQHRYLQKPEKNSKPCKNQEALGDDPVWHMADFIVENMVRCSY